MKEPFINSEKIIDEFHKKDAKDKKKYCENINKKCEDCNNDWCVNKNAEVKNG